MKNKIISLIMFIVICFGLMPSMVLAYDTVDVYVNGNLLKTDQPAIIYQDRTMVPLRAICEKLKCTVEWDDYTNTALIENKISMVAAQINNYTLTKKDRRIEKGKSKSITIDVPPMIINKRTLVPVRAISEALNAKVDWDGKKRVDITMEYDWISDYVEGVATVDKNGIQGAIDKNGKLIVPIKYDFVAECENGYIKVGNKPQDEDRKVGLYDDHGELVIPVKYYDLGKIYRGVMPAEKNGMCGLLDTDGDIVLPFIYDDMNDFYEGLATVRDEEGHYGFINTDGDLVIDLGYQTEVGSFCDGVAYRMWGGQGGYINKHGEEIIPYKYKDVQNFSEGLAWVQNEEWKYGAIDKNDNVIIPFIYDDAEEFVDGIALVIQHDENESGVIYKWGAIDTEGNYIYDMKYSAWDGPVWGGTDMYMRGLEDSYGNTVFEQEYLWKPGLQHWD